MVAAWSGQALPDFHIQPLRGLSADDIDPPVLGIVAGALAAARAGRDLAFQPAPLIPGRVIAPGVARGAGGGLAAKQEEGATGCVKGQRGIATRSGGRAAEWDFGPGAGLHIKGPQVALRAGAEARRAPAVQEHAIAGGIIDDRVQAALERFGT